MATAAQLVELLTPFAAPRPFPDVAALAAWAIDWAQGDPLDLRCVEVAPGHGPNLPAVRIACADGSRERFLGYATIAPPGGWEAQGLDPAPPALNEQGRHRAEPALRDLRAALDAHGARLRAAA